MEDKELPVAIIHYTPFEYHMAPCVEIQGKWFAQLVGSNDNMELEDSKPAVLYEGQQFFFGPFKSFNLAAVFCMWVISRAEVSEDATPENTPYLPGLKASHHTVDGIPFHMLDAPTLSPEEYSFEIKVVGTH
jgi:hypothetical protein